ncbi:MAG: 30S ribosomal protein S12 methylthiotransferase RimO [Desulfarculus sp.]|nr:30S ribosomal protein S12 methylthiotransferase RimO [Desulfarculus sp.]
MSTYYLLNLGCAKNQVEGEHLAGMLLAAGWQGVADPGQAELLLVNTCGFIKPAVQENIAAILDLAAAKRPGQRLAVVGCLVGRYGKKLAASLPEVDLLVGPGEAARLLEHLQAAPPGRLAISQPREVFGFEHPRALSTGPGWAYLRLGDGCEHDCAFCTIPRIRGRFRSRPMHDVLAEAQRLAEAGARELNLVAQDLCSYGRDLKDGSSLEALLPEMASIGALSWIRLLYLSPDSLEKPLIQTMARTPKVLPYFDLPLQHISGPVLQAMGRKRSGAELRALLSEIRQAVPNAVLRTTLLVGHPGEGEAEFTELREFVQGAGFDHLGCFAYQPEAGTRSARLPAPPAKLGAARRRQIMATQKAVSRAKQKALKGQELEILVLGPHPESDLLGLGRLARQAPEVDGEVIITDGQAEPGSLARCRITKAHAYDLEAVLL